MRNPKLKVMSTRITESLARVVEEYLRIDAHVGPADLLRDALREKLKRDVPDLYKTMYQEAGATANYCAVDAATHH